MVWPAIAATLLTCLGQAPADAQAAVAARTSIKGHRFAPAEVRVPANTPVTLVIRNLDPTPEEIESKTLRVEKIVAGKSEITIHLRPLAPGRYRFYGDFNEATAEGAIVAEYATAALGHFRTCPPSAHIARGMRWYWWARCPLKALRDGCLPCFRGEALSVPVGMPFFHPVDDIRRAARSFLDAAVSRASLNRGI